MTTREDLRYDTSQADDNGQTGELRLGVSRSTVFRGTVADSIARLVRVTHSELASYGPEEQKLAAIALLGAIYPYFSVKAREDFTIAKDAHDAIQELGIIVGSPDLIG